MVNVGDSAEEEENGSGFTLFSPTLNAESVSLQEQHVDKQQRYVVKQFMGRTSAKGVSVSKFKICSEKGEMERVLYLKNDWSQLTWMSSGTLVNIVGVLPDSDGSFTVERGKGYLIVEPDRLISVTNVIGQLYCERKAALTSRFYMGGGDNALMFRGVVAHELITLAMDKRLSSKGEIAKYCRGICERQDMLERAYGIGLTDDDLGKIQEDVTVWVDRFINNRYLNNQPKDANQNFQFVKLLGVEDNIWSPTYGLKGKIDATVMIKKRGQNKDANIIVPLEFKTGSIKSQKRQVVKADHVGQVMLYTLMMGLKYGNVEESLLYYISDDSLSAHSSKGIELQHLILLRNKYVHNTMMADGKLLNLPRADADFDFKCKTCEVKSVCTLQVRNEGLPAGSLNKTEKQLLNTTILKDADFAFLDEWLQAIHLETEQVEKKFNDMQIWKKTPAEREAAGTCIGNLKLPSSLESQVDCKGKKGFLITLRRGLGDSQDIANLIPDFIHVDDYVIFSSNVEVAVATAVVMMIKQCEITIFLEEPLHEDYFKTDFTFTLDKVNATSPIASQYGYLIKLMEDNSHAANLREYIIQKKQPRFGKLSIPPKEVQEVIEPLNVEQKRVVTKAMATDSLLLVKGCPGSGKTTTIVSLIRSLVQNKKSVLVVTYTGTALENILTKYKRYSGDFFKMTPTKLESDLAQHTPKTITKSINTIDKIAKVYNKSVIGTTLLSLRHPVFQARRFDYCIVDEASQALPTAVLGAMHLSDKCILFGDPNQLPAVIQSNTLMSRIVHDNFFSLLSTPACTVKLTIQYRMNKAIMDVANALMYEGQMKCGSKGQEQQHFPLKEDDLRKFLLTKCDKNRSRRVLCNAGSKLSTKAVFFLDTSDISAFETKRDETLHNERERDVVLALCRYFIGSLLDPKELGIIAPYRGQVNLIRDSLRSIENAKFHQIEVNTVDQFQGKEMEAIICSFTKSQDSVMMPPANGPATREGILEDIRRLNVALTRARTKLVLIGNRSFLQRYTPLAKLHSIIGKNYKIDRNEMIALRRVAKGVQKIKNPQKESAMETEEQAKQLPENGHVGPVEVEMASDCSSMDISDDDDVFNEHNEWLDTLRNTSQQKPAAKTNGALKRPYPEPIKVTPNMFQIDTESSSDESDDEGRNVDADLSGCNCNY